MTTPDRYLFAMDDDAFPVIRGVQLDMHKPDAHLARDGDGAKGHGISLPTVCHSLANQRAGARRSA